MNSSYYILVVILLIAGNHCLTSRDDSNQLTHQLDKNKQQRCHNHNSYRITDPITNWYLHTPIPKKDSWQWIYFFGQSSVVYPGFNVCFFVQDKKLYLYDKTAWILPNDVVEPDDYEWAFAGDKDYIQSRSSRYFGQIEAIPCDKEKTKFKFKCTQFKKGKFYTSYLLNTRRDTTWSIFLYWAIGKWKSVKFVGSQQIKKQPEELYCFSRTG